MLNDIEQNKWNKIQDVILAPLRAIINHDTDFNYKLIDINHRASIQAISKLEPNTVFSIKDCRPTYIGEFDGIDGISVEFRESVLVVNNMLLTYVFDEYISHQQDINYIKEVAKVIQGESSNKVSYKRYVLVMSKQNFIDLPYIIPTYTKLWEEESE